MSLGVIEGFYGETWGWRARTAALPFLASAGFTFFIYAPKSDRRLRREWRQAHEPGEAKEIRDFGAACRAAGIEFGVGLTPLALHEAWDGEGRADLERRLESLRLMTLWTSVLPAIERRFNVTERRLVPRTGTRRVFGPMRPMIFGSLLSWKHP